MISTKEIFMDIRQHDAAHERDMKSYQESKLLDLAYEEGRIDKPAKKWGKKK